MKLTEGYRNINKKIFIPNAEKNKRIKQLRSLYNSINFNGKILLIGFGCVGRALFFMIARLFNMNYDKFYIIDKQDKSSEIKTILDRLGNIKQVKYEKCQITQHNYKDKFDSINFSKNDLIIDCSYMIDTSAIMDYCSKHQLSYINSCIEDWDYTVLDDPFKYSLYCKHQKLEKQSTKYAKNYNLLVSMGCNPGNVSIWCKMGIDLIAREKNLYAKSHAELAKELDIRTIHISERDTQISNVPKKINEYCNTWSSDGECYYEEALGCVEMSIGTHENVNYPNQIYRNNGYAIFDVKGIDTYAQSYLPYYGRYIGQIIRHDEAYTIGKNLEVRSNNELIYKPSVYYVYHPTNDSRMSIEELKERNYIYQDKWRLLTDEIISGRDILGLTYYLGNGDIYWIGSLLDITESRELFENKMDEFVNATNTQVVAGFLSGIIQLIDMGNKGIYKGFIVPEDLDYKKAFSIQKLFLGEFSFHKLNEKFCKYSRKFTKNTDSKFNWSLPDFLV